MDEVAVRIIVVGGVVAAALAVSWFFRSAQSSAHPRLRIPPGDLAAGVVLFTATDCDQCAAARAALKAAGISYREVTFEIESSRFERYGVQAVPLVARLEENGDQAHLAAGVPTRRSLRKLKSAS